MFEPQANSTAKVEQGNSQPQSGDGGEAKNLTEQQVNELANRAITSRFKSFESKFEKSFTDLAAGFTGKFEEFSKSIESLKPKQEPEKPKSKDAAPSPLTELPEFQAIQKDLAEQKRKVAEAEKKAADELARRRDSYLRQTLDETLLKAGVDGKAVRQARAFLIADQKAVRFAEDGETLVYVKGDEETDLASGLKSWVKTDEAKIYLPPRGTAGTGDRGGGSAPTQPEQGPSKQQLGEWLLKTV